MTINHYRDYCESEYNLAKNCLSRHNPFSIYSPKEVKHNTVQRLLGAGYLAQQMGASYEEVEQVFNFYKEKVEKIEEPLDK